MLRAVWLSVVWASVCAAGEVSDRVDASLRGCAFALEVTGRAQAERWDEAQQQIDALEAHILACARSAEEHLADPEPVDRQLDGLSALQGVLLDYVAERRDCVEREAEVGPLDLRRTAAVCLRAQSLLLALQADLAEVPDQDEDDGFARAALREALSQYNEHLALQLRQLRGVFARHADTVERLESDLERRLLDQRIRHEQEREELRYRLRNMEAEHAERIRDLQLDQESDSESMRRYVWQLQLDRYAPPLPDASPLDEAAEQCGAPPVRWSGPDPAPSVTWPRAGSVVDALDEWACQLDATWNQVDGEVVLTPCPTAELDDGTRLVALVGEDEAMTPGAFEAGARLQLEVWRRDDPLRAPAVESYTLEFGSDEDPTLQRGLELAGGSRFRLVYADGRVREVTVLGRRWTRGEAPDFWQDYASWELTLALDETLLPEAVAFLCGVTGKNVILDPGLAERTVTFEVESTLSEALYDLCAEVGAEATWLGEALVVHRPEHPPTATTLPDGDHVVLERLRLQPVHLRCDATPASEVCGFLSAITGLSWRAPESLDACQVDLQLEALPLVDVLDVLSYLTQTPWTVDLELPAILFGPDSQGYPDAAAEGELLSCERGELWEALQDALPLEVDPAVSMARSAWTLHDLAATRALDLWCAERGAVWQRDDEVIRVTPAE